MRIHILQHAEVCSPGSLLEWIQQPQPTHLKPRERDARIVRLDRGEALPSLDETDWVIVLGGPMGVDDVEAHPFLAAEKAFLKSAIDAGKTVLGICPGSQLLAEVLGAEVKQHDHWEIGWHPVLMGQNAASDSRVMVFQWHQDTFSLPPGTVRVASNRITENQAFMYGNRVLGLQFHAEATEPWIEGYLAQPLFPEGPHCQNREQILEGLVFLTPLKRWFFELLGHMETLTLKAAR